MRRLLLCLVVFTMLAGSAMAEPITANVNEKVYDAVLRLDTVSDMALLKDLYLTVVDRDGSDFLLEASAEEIAYLRQLGYVVEVSGRNDQRQDKANYYTYASAMTELQTIVQNFPQLTKLVELGTSWQDRKVVALKISDNAADEEAEPALLYDATIHGNESIGTETAFGFIHYLLDNYGSDADVTSIVDNNEVWIVPFVNPDGLSNNTRGNAHGVDMNRNYGFFWEGYGVWSPEPETVALMDFMIAEKAMLTVSYHSGAELVNYTWDSIYTDSPEKDLEIAMSNVYAIPSNYDITNGADWYIADATAEDFYHGSIGSISVIVEISMNKEPAYPQAQNYVDRNVPAMIDWALQSERGVRGFVYDATTDLPVEAVIIAGTRLPVTSDADLGDYYRLLPTGDHTLSVWANGYGWTDFNVTVPASGYAEEDLDLNPSNDPVMAAIRCSVNIRKDTGDDPANVTLPTAALGGHDGAAFSTGVNGYAVFDMGELTPVVDGAGEDLTVYENGNDEGYSVSVATDWTGPWQAIGTGMGTASFDIAASGLDEIRYVLIRDDGDGANTGVDPGVDIDAIEAVIVCEAPSGSFTASPTSGSAPLNVNFTSDVTAAPGCFSGLSWDFGDGESSTEANPSHVYQDAGTFTVTLTITGPGGSDMVTKENLITVTGSGDDDDTVTDDDTTADDDDDDDDAFGDDDDDDDGCGC